MEALLGAALAVGACCGLPLAIGGVAFLLGRGKKKDSGVSAAHSTDSAFDACCKLSASVVKSGVRRLRSKDRQAEIAAEK
jgi:hypothetical protein